MDPASISLWVTGLGRSGMGSMSIGTSPSSGSMVWSARRQAQLCSTLPVCTISWVGSVVELQFGHGLVQALADRAELLAPFGAEVAQGLVGRTKTLQQVAGGVVEQAFEPLQVRHGHEQRILEVGHQIHGQGDRRRGLLHRR